MKILFIGCVKFSEAMLQEVLQHPQAQVVGIVTREESKFNADFASLKPIAQKNDIPYFISRTNEQKEMATWIQSHQPDIIYCFGWSYLLKKEILKSSPLGIIGYHPAALPQNRGRHPIVWALALGLNETASTFFFMDEGADSGDIISQVKVPIDQNDDAATLYRKLVSLSKSQVADFTTKLANQSFQRLPQDHSLANSWRKRGKRDGEIDWRMSAKTIHNLVRALTRPYVGAHCIYRNKEIKIWKSQLLTDDPKNLEPGMVLRSKGKEIDIKCGKGVIRITKHEFETLPKERSYL